MVVRRNGSSSQKQGQELYKKGEFRAAVTAFSEALVDKNADSLGILDNRAAAYTKLSQYDLALRDAKQMIKKCKNDQRGYLRCAKVLLLSGKPEKAQEVYAYALKNLSEDSPGRELLQQLHDKLQGKLATCKDPFTVLPLEMAAMVLQHFDFKQIVAILRVSKGWERFLSSFPKLWMQIDLRRARGKINWTSVRSYIRRSKAMLTHAIIANISLSATDKTMELLSRCPNLEHLEVWIPYGITKFLGLFQKSQKLKSLTFSQHTTVPQACAVNLLAGFPLLESVTFLKTRGELSAKVTWPLPLPNIKSISLRSEDASTISGFGETLPLEVPGIEGEPQPIQGGGCLIPNLEELRLEWEPETWNPYPISINMIDFSCLRRLELKGMELREPCRLPLGLEYLRIAGGRTPSRFVEVEEGTRLSNLRTLILDDIPWNSLCSLDHFLITAKPPLSTLHLDSLIGCKASDLRVLLDQGALSNLETLSLCMMRGLDDRFISILMERLGSLKTLNLSYSQITGCAVKNLADARTSDNHTKSKLQQLIVRGCDDVSSDAVAYGRERGIHIIT